MFSFFKKKGCNTKTTSETQMMNLKAYISGKVIPIEEVKDEVFASKVMGDGIGIIPKGDMVTAPGEGVISVVMTDSKHAVGIRLDNGAEILIHEGIDTVKMNGEGFELYVKEGDRVKSGDRLLKFNRRFIQEKGFDTTCICVLTNGDKFPNVKFVTGIEAVQGETTVVTF